MITDEQLQIAAARSCHIYISVLTKGYDPKSSSHTFSSNFEEKIKKLRRRADHPIFYRTMQRVASILLALIIAGSTWLAIDGTARAVFFGWIKETYEMFFIYRYSDPNISIEEYDYCLTQIPDGYSEYMEIDEHGGVTILYKNETGQLMKFGYIHSSASTMWYIDTTDTVQSDAVVHGQPADLFISTSENVASILLWTSDGDNSAFYISGFFSESKLVSIAESIIRVE